MTRYRALRIQGCDWFTAWFISSMNTALKVPAGEIRFMSVVMEYHSEPTENTLS